MKTSEKFAPGAVSTLAGLTMAASMVAVPLAAVADEAPDQGTPAGSGDAATVPAAGKNVQSGIVKTAAVGTFAYDQTTVSPIADIAKMQGASSTLCGAKDVASTMDATSLSWTITVSGDVENEFCATVDELVGEDSVNQLMTCSCGGNPAGGRAIVTADVKGIPVEYLLARAGAAADANTVTFVAADGTEVAMPIGYVIGRHGVLSCELNSESIAEALGSGNQLWLAKTPANYFVRDVVEIVVSTEAPEDVPATPGEGAEHPNSPNAGILAGSQE